MNKYTARRPRYRGLLAVIWLGAPLLAFAGPFMPAGDLGLRHDVQLLADYGVIKSTVTAWPMSWDTLAADLATVENLEQLPAAIQTTVLRLQARVDNNTRRNDTQLRGRLSVAEKPMAIRGFQNTPREDVEGSAGVSWLGERLSVNLQVTGVDSHADGQDVRADGSEIGLRLGNFTYAASVTDRWWGPGWDGSLILSNNARPIPALTIRRDVLIPFETKWLSWLGPWDLRAMWGQMESDRVVPNAKFFGMRFNFRPHPSLEIGISRSAQFCGEGRPCDLGTFWKILIGNDNLGENDIGFEDEPSNQLAGFDVRWSNTWFGTPMAFYGQMIGEDEAGGFPNRYMAMGGVELSGWSERRQLSYRWFAEVAGVSCDIFDSNPSHNCAYNHRIYQTGYRYRGRVVGHGAEGGALIGTLGMVMVTGKGNQVSALVRSGELNKGASQSNTLTPIPLDIVSADITYAHIIGNNRLEIGVGYQETENSSLGSKTDETRGFIQWRYNP